MYSQMYSLELFLNNILLDLLVKVYILTFPEP